MSNDNSAAQAARRSLTRARIAMVVRHWPIAPIVLLFLGLGIYYSVTVPIFEAPDEPEHYAAVRLALAGEAAGADVWMGDLDESYAPRPPLYDVIGAQLIRTLDIDLTQPAYERNPYDARGEPHSQGNKNAVLHAPDEGWPFRGTSLAMRVLRWFSLLCSACTVVLTYILALAIAPTRRSLAACAAALVAFNPQFLFVSASVTNGTLATALVTGTLLGCVRVLNDRADRWSSAVVLGLTAGAAALTDPIGLAVAAMLLAAYAGWALLRRPRGERTDTAGRRADRAVWISLAIALAVMLATAGWWYVRQATVAGVPSAVATSLEGAARADRLPWAEVLTRVRGAFISYWGVFGWMNVLADEFYYTLVHVLTIVGMVGALLFVVRVRWRAGTLRQHRWPAVLLLLGWAVLCLGQLVWRTRLGAGPQGRWLFPAIAPISVILAMGLMAWVPRHVVPFATGAVAVALAIVAAVLPWRTIAPAYAASPRVTLEEAPASMRALDIAYGDELFLLGCETLDDQLLAGQDLRLRLYWVALKRMSENYTLYVQVFGRDGELIGSEDTYPGAGNYPTSLWLPGEVVSEDYRIAIAADALTPVAATVRVGVYAGSTTGSLSAFQADGGPLARNPAITRVRVGGPLSQPASPPNVLEASFDGRLRLDGYALERAGLQAGDAWNLTLYWTVVERPIFDYTVYVHLVDQQGQIVDQADSPPLGGDLPTSFARPGDHLDDRHTLTLTNALEPGEYTLEVGLYLLETFERLPVVGGDEPADHVVIETLTVGGTP